MATENNNINKPTRKRKKTAQQTAKQQGDAPNLTPMGVELAQNADDVATADGAKANREWDPHMGARDDTPKTVNEPARQPEITPVDGSNQSSTGVNAAANVPQRADGTYNDEASDRSGVADAVDVSEQGAEKGDAQISENLGTISQGGDVAEDKKAEGVLSSVPSNDAKSRQRYDDIQRENAALQQKKDGISGISSIVKADSASAQQLSGAVDAIDAKVADNDNGIAEMFADDAKQKSQQKKEADAFAKQKEQAEAMQAVKDIDWDDDAQVSGLDKETVRVAMADAFPESRVDLFNRPHVPAEDMRKAGYDVPDGSSASVYSMGFDVDGKEVLVTPIVDNGDGTYTVMSEDEVARYVGNLNPADPESDDLGLVISWDSKPDDGYRLHKMQEAFYATPQLVSSNGERVKEEPEEKAPQDSEKKGTSEEKGGDADAENGMSFWLKPSSESVPKGGKSVPNVATEGETEKPKAAVEPEEPYLDLKSADEYGISEDNGEDVEEDVEGGTIRYKDYSKADREAYDRLNEDEKKNYDAIKSKIAEYDAAIKAARDDKNLPEVLEYNRLKAEYEAELAEYNDPDKLKKRRARRKIAVFADVLSAIANMWGAYKGAKPIELKSATGAIGDAETAEAKTLKERLKEYQKLADTARKEVNKEIARLDKADAATLAAYSKRLTRDYDKWRAAQEKEIENAKKKRDTANQKSRDAQQREIKSKNELERSKERIDYSNAKSVESHAAKAATTDKYKQKAEGRANKESDRRKERDFNYSKQLDDYKHRDEE